MAQTPDWVTLRLVLAAIEEGSLSRAAERCAIAVSAAARRVQLLEAQHGVRLLDRTARGVHPTPAGEAFANHARGLIDRSARLADDLRAFATGGRGSVRLHCTASAITGHRLACLLAGFMQAEPGIRVELEEAPSLSVLRSVLEGRADLGIVMRPAVVPDALAFRPWQQDRLLVVVPAAHPLAGREALRFVEVLAEPLVGVLAGGALALTLAEEAQRLGRAPRWRFQVQGTDAARLLIAAGHGLGVMPEGVVRPHEERLGIRGVPLAEPWAERLLGIVARAAEPLGAPGHRLLDHLISAAVPG